MGEQQRFHFAAECFIAFAALKNESVAVRPFQGKRLAENCLDLGPAAISVWDHGRASGQPRYQAASDLHLWLALASLDASMTPNYHGRVPGRLQADRCKRAGTGAGGYVSPELPRSAMPLLPRGQFSNRAEACRARYER